MNNQKLQETIAQAILLDREIAALTTELSALKKMLVAEAASRKEEHVATAGGGKTWTAQDAVGNIAHVIFPAPALKACIDGESKLIEKIRAAAGQLFPRLFRQAPKYVPIETFRNEAEALLGAAAGRKLIRLCESKSLPRVAFETKELKE